MLGKGGRIDWLQIRPSWFTLVKNLHQNIKLAESSYEYQWEMISPILLMISVLLTFSLEANHNLKPRYDSKQFFVIQNI